MQIENVWVENLYEDCRDGLVFLRVCRRIDPNVVNDKLNGAKLTPKNLFDNSHNCNLAEQAMRDLGVRMVGVGAQDIVDGVKKNILAMVWQLMKVHYLKIIGNKTDAQILAWANETLQLDQPLANFKDP